MPRLPVTDDELDIEEMEAAEYDDSGSSFEPYDGEQPPKGTVLNGAVTKMWWTDTAAGDRMFKVLWVAEDNEGDLAEYDGLPIWENIALISTAKFKWKPFIDRFGFTLQDIKKKLIVDADDDQFGAPIQKIGKFEPDTDAAVSRVITGRHKYQGDWQTDITTWLQDGEGVEEPDEPEVDEPEEAEEAPEEEAPRATRGGRRAAAPAKAATPARAGARGARTAKAAPAKAASAKPARGSRRGATASSDGDDEPPF